MLECLESKESRVSMQPNKWNQQIGKNNSERGSETKTWTHEALVKAR